MRAGSGDRPFRLNGADDERVRRLEREHLAAPGDEAARVAYVEAAYEAGGGIVREHPFWAVRVTGPTGRVVVWEDAILRGDLHGHWTPASALGATVGRAAAVSDVGRLAAEHPGNRLTLWASAETEDGRHVVATGQVHSHSFVARGARRDDLWRRARPRGPLRWNPSDDELRSLERAAIASGSDEDRDAFLAAWGEAGPAEAEEAYRRLVARTRVIFGLPDLAWIIEAAFSQGLEFRGDPPILLDWLDWRIVRPLEPSAPPSVAMVVVVGRGPDATVTVGLSGDRWDARNPALAWHLRSPWFGPPREGSGRAVWGEAHPMEIGTVWAARSGIAAAASGPFASVEVEPTREELLAWASVEDASRVSFPRRRVQEWLRWRRWGL